MRKDDVLTFNSIKKFNCKTIFQKEKGFGSALIEELNISKQNFVVFLMEMVLLI